ncbi:hypothetical protein MUN89_15905 [Halobacillus salinarum]|uniref:DUF5673 domain-containing protein n=1 Tax=Halobacillus salinarum TaxID=2932257 RepID=A0ABY4EH56_9BACI|nr:anti-phage protein KwaA [Halobacillus salinarum]UOQ43393.1 hypothetical protein MUN89_15905 [Halobacillus salinarum]
MVKSYSYAITDYRGGSHIENRKIEWEKIELYIISLWLLFLLIFIVTIDIPLYFKKDWKFIGIVELLKMNILPVSSLFLLILGIIFASRFKYKLSGSNRTPFKIHKIQNINYEHLTFLSTYIVPLIAFDLSKIKYVIVLIILLVTIGGIYIKTDLFYANPSLALLGYRIYKVDGIFYRGGESNTREDLVIISREKLKRGMKVSYKEINDNIYYVRVENG